MKLHDYHIHSGLLRHTSNNPNEIVKTAIRLDYQKICIVEHFSYLFANMDYVEWNLDYDTLAIKPSSNGRVDLEKFFKMINKLKKEYKKEIEILIGLEVDFFQDYSDQISSCISKYDFDIILGSCHYLVDPFEDGKWVHISSDRVKELYNKLGHKWLYSTYFNNVLNGVSSGLFDYLAHLDFPKKKFPIRFDSKINDLIDYILKNMIKKSVGLEINTKGVNDSGEVYPSKGIIDRYLKLGGRKICIGSDSHSTDEMVKSKDLVRAYIKKYTIQRKE